MCEEIFFMFCLYVDNLIYASNCDNMFDFKKVMMNEYEMSDLGLMRYFLHILVQKKKGEIFISQANYVDDLLKKVNI